MSKTPETARYMDYFERAMRLKDVPRTGWVTREVPNPESVADHTWGTIIIADRAVGLVSEQLGIPLDKQRLKDMLLVHDLGEIDGGDKVVQRGIVIDIKARRKKIAEERRSLMRTSSIIRRTAEDLSLFMEFEKGETPLAKVAIAIDKLEPEIHAHRLELAAGRISDKFNDFYVGNDEVYEIAPFFQNMHREILRRRDQMRMENTLISMDSISAS